MHYFMNKKLISIYNKLQYLIFGYFILWKILKKKNEKEIINYEK